MENYTHPKLPNRVFKLINYGKELGTIQDITDKHVEYIIHLEDLVPVVSTIDILKEILDIS